MSKRLCLAPTRRDQNMRRDGGRDEDTCTVKIMGMMRKWGCNQEREAEGRQIRQIAPEGRHRMLHRKDRGIGDGRSA